MEVGCFAFEEDVAHGGEVVEVPVGVDEVLVADEWGFFGWDGGLECCLETAVVFVDDEW